MCNDQLDALRLKVDETIVERPLNDEGQPTPPTGNAFIIILSDGYHSLPIRSDGTIACWGNNDFGEPMHSTVKVGESHSAGAFGQPNQASFLGNRFMFTGREYDAESGLYYYRARYYSPAIGRFLQPDPIGYAAGLNLYTYVTNNPLKWIDPWGLCEDRKKELRALVEEYGKRMKQYYDPADWKVCGDYQEKTMEWSKDLGTQHYRLDRATGHKTGFLDSGPPHAGPPLTEMYVVVLDENGKVVLMLDPWSHYLWGWHMFTYGCWVWDTSGNCIYQPLPPWPGKGPPPPVWKDYYNEEFFECP